MFEWIKIVRTLNTEYRILELLLNDPTYSDEGSIGVTHLEVDAFDFMEKIRKGTSRDMFYPIKNLYGRELIGFTPPFEEILEPNQTIYITPEGKAHLHNLKLSKYQAGMQVIVNILVAIVSAALGIVGALFFLN